MNPNKIHKEKNKVPNRPQSPAKSPQGKNSAPPQGKKSVPLQGKKSTPPQGKNRVPPQGKNTILNQGKNTILNLVLIAAVVAVGMSLAACHTATTALVLSDSVYSATQKKQEAVSMDSWTNFTKNLSLQFDSLQMTIEPIAGQSSPGIHEHDSLTYTGQRITIRAARARVSSNETLARHDSMRAMSYDSIRVTASSHTKKQNTDEVMAVYQPPNMALVIIAIAALIGTVIVILFLKRRSDK